METYPTVHRHTQCGLTPSLIVNLGWLGNSRSKAARWETTQRSFVVSNRMCPLVRSYLPPRRAVVLPNWGRYAVTLVSPNYTRAADIK